MPLKAEILKLHSDSEGVYLNVLESDQNPNTTRRIVIDQHLTDNNIITKKPNSEILGVFRFDSTNKVYIIYDFGELPEENIKRLSQHIEDLINKLRDYGKNT